MNWSISSKLSNLWAEGKVVYSISYYFNVYGISCDGPFSFLILIIYIFSLFFLVNLASILSVVLNLSKNQLLVSFIWGFSLFNLFCLGFINFLNLQIYIFCQIWEVLTIISMSTFSLLPFHLSSWYLMIQMIDLVALFIFFFLVVCLLCCLDWTVSIVLSFSLKILFSISYILLLGSFTKFSFYFLFFFKFQHLLSLFSITTGVLSSCRHIQTQTQIQHNIYIQLSAFFLRLIYICLHMPQPIV